MFEQFKKQGDKFIQKTKEEMAREEELYNQQVALMKQAEEEERKEILHARNLANKTCEKLNKFLEQQDVLYSQAENKDEVIHIDSYGFIFDNEGFSYNAVVVSDTQTGVLLVDYKGIQYSVNLVAGVNQLNILNGSRLKTNATNGLDVVIVKSNTKLV